MDDYLMDEFILLDHIGLLNNVLEGAPPSKYKNDLK